MYAVSRGDRVILSRAITLVESNNKDHFKLAQQVLQAVLPRTGKALASVLLVCLGPVKVHLLKPLVTCSLKLVTRWPCCCRPSAKSQRQYFGR